MSDFYSYKADPKKLSDDLDLHEQGWVQDWDYLSRNENRQKYFILSVEELRGLINMAQERLLGPNDAQTLALIEDRKLTVTWHFNGHHVQAICYDHKGNNRVASVDLGIAVAECIKRCDATGTPQEKNNVD